MSGQSTLLWALGANVLLAKALDICTADHAVIPATTVCTSIGHMDDLGRGVSYFYAEAEAIAEVLTEARRRRALFLFDELFRGTNAGERMAAAEMVMRAVLAGGPDTVCSSRRSRPTICNLASCWPTAFARCIWRSTPTVRRCDSTTPSPRGQRAPARR
jgi:hypothetical protein